MWTLLDKAQECNLRNVVFSFSDGKIPAHICKTRGGYVFMVGSGYVARTGVGPMTYEQSTVWPEEIIDAFVANTPVNAEQKQTTNPPNPPMRKPQQNGKGKGK